MGFSVVSTSGFLGRVDELIHIKHLELCLAWSEFSIHVIYGRHYSPQIQCILEGRDGKDIISVGEAARQAATERQEWETVGALGLEQWYPPAGAGKGQAGDWRLTRRWWDEKWEREFRARHLSAEREVEEGWKGTFRPDWWRLSTLHWAYV